MKAFANLSPLDLTCALISAICHDFKHDGFNNLYHSKTKSERFSIYGEIGVQEKFHFAESWIVVEEVNLLGMISAEQKTMFK